MFHHKQETGRDSGGSDYFQVGHRNSGKRHLSSMAAESLSLSLPVVKVVCEHSRRSKGFWQETDGAVKIACYSQSLPLYLLYGSLQLISGTVYCSQVQVSRKAGSQPAAHIWDTNYETSGERKKERVKYDSHMFHMEKTGCLSWFDQNNQIGPTKNWNKVTSHKAC